MLSFSDQVSIIMWVWAQLTDIWERLELSWCVPSGSSMMKCPRVLPQEGVMGALLLWGRDGVTGRSPLWSQVRCSRDVAEGTERRPATSRLFLARAQPAEGALPRGGAGAEGQEWHHRLGLRPALETSLGSFRCAAVSFMCRLNPANHVGGDD